MARHETEAHFPRRGHDHGRCVADAVAAAETLCRRDGLRLTELRRRVLELVWSSHQPIGAYAILDSLRGDGRSAAPPTVYRALEFLLARGLVHRLASLNAFVGCDRPGREHAVHFFICERCRSAAEFADRRVAEAVERSAAGIGFAVTGKVIELTGLCARCRSEAPGPGPAPTPA